MWASLLDVSGNTLCKGVSFIIPGSLRENEIAEFSITLPVKKVAGTKLQFTYRYFVMEELDGAGYWIQSFEAAEPREKE